MRPFKNRENQGQGFSRQTTTGMGGGAVWDGGKVSTSVKEWKQT